MPVESSYGATEVWSQLRAHPLIRALKAYLDGPLSGIYFTIVFLEKLVVLLLGCLNFLGELDGFVSFVLGFKIP